VQTAKERHLNPKRLLLLSMALLALLFCRADARDAERLTPLLLSVQESPIPFLGSDGRTHLVYELSLTNFSSSEMLVESVDVIAEGVILKTLIALPWRNGCSPLV